MMFDLREFVMKTLRGMAENEPAYKVNRYALGWFEKDVLTTEDLAEVDALTNEPEAAEETRLPQEEQQEGTEMPAEEETAEESAEEA